MNTRTVFQPAFIVAMLVLLATSPIAAQCHGEVKSYQKISALYGGLVGALLEGDNFGADVDALGRDPDGDGPIAEVLAVVAEFDDDPEFNNGAVYVLFIGATGMVQDYVKITGFTGSLDCHAAGGRCVLDSVNWIGNLDGEGAEDLAVGTIGDDTGGVDAGALWILFLNDDFTLASTQKISATNGPLVTTQDRFGSGVTWLGDLGSAAPTSNALAVGALGPFNPLATPDSTPGRVWILFLNDDGTPNDWVEIGDGLGGFSGAIETLDHFGSDVDAMGDLDGDGVTDLAVGAKQDDDGGGAFCMGRVIPDCNRGAVWILFLHSDGTVRDQQAISDLEGGFEGVLENLDNFGARLHVMGDLGPQAPTPFALAVGAHGDDDGGASRGAVWILFLEPDGTVRAHRKISDTEGNLPAPLGDGDQFAGAAWLGDLDGDGIGDLAVGARGDDDTGLGTCLTFSPPRCDLGATYVLFLNAPLDLVVTDASLIVHPGGAAVSFDVVRGDLEELRANGYATAQEECVANETQDPTVPFTEDPAPGEGWWFLARRVTSGDDTFDTCGESQAGTRDDVTVCD